VALVSFPDHHAFSSADVSAIVRRAPRHDFVVCTLKDAVKLAPLWPRASTPLWYVSQRIALEEGAAEYDAAIQQVLAARLFVSTTR
jgi:tetraacyldisaccharide 4'-kinase